MMIENKNKNSKKNCVGWETNPQPLAPQPALFTAAPQLDIFHWVKRTETIRRWSARPSEPLTIGKIRELKSWLQKNI